MSKFIVIEALDAGGSQTQTNRLAQHLIEGSYQVLQLHFPQEDQQTGRFIYEKFLLAHNKPKFTRREQALIYIQDFYSQADAIQTHLSRSTKSIVVSDRFYTSTLAYQTIGLTGRSRQGMLSWIKSLAEQGTHHLPHPDLVIFLDTPVSTSLHHLKNKTKDFFENKQKLTAIRNSYLRQAQEEKWLVINSVNNRGEQRSIEDIHDEIWSRLSGVI
jgi:dTMP kinase